MNRIRTKDEFRNALDVVYDSPNSPLKAIREKCKDCCCGSTLDVRYCSATGCSLHPFRFGRNPFRKRRALTDDQRHAIATRLANGRNKEV